MADEIGPADSGPEDSGSESAPAKRAAPAPVESQPKKAPRKKRKKAEKAEKAEESAHKKGEDGEGEGEGEDGEAKDGDDLAGISRDKDNDEYESRMTEQRNRFLLSQLSPEQQKRYEIFRRAGFQRSAIKKVMQGVANTPISQTMAIVMGGISKVYVGELVETARTVMEECEEPPGPLQPRHIREAYRRLKQSNSVPAPVRYSKRLFHK